MAKAASTPMMATTIISSTSVKPRLFNFEYALMVLLFRDSSI